jgi:hypothetical protein
MASIIITQRPLIEPGLDRSKVHPVINQIISPDGADKLSAGGHWTGGLLQEVSQTGRISEFLFEMRKDGGIYWIGAAVPEGTSDFSKVQVYFHPTVDQRQRDGHVVHHAKESDYPTFSGGWSGSLERYVAMQGGQLAGVRQTTLIVPFMTMSAFSGRAPAYMFATRPRDTLDLIMTTVRDVMAPWGTGPGGRQAPLDGTTGVRVSQIGVSSFSSGIGAMRLFIRTFGHDRLIKETTDFDGPQIVGEPKIITRAPGAVGRVFTQVAPPHPQHGWVWLPAQSFHDIQKWRDKGPHAQIGWMTYFMASKGSVIR